MEMLGEGSKIRVIRGVVMPKYLTSFGPTFPVIGILTKRVKIDIHISAIDKIDPQLARPK